MKSYSSLELAFIGDAVHTLFVRKNVLSRGGKLNALHLSASKFCSAKFQSKVLEKILSQLTENEQDVVRMARNSRPKHTAKNSDPADYHKATAFEALVGYLYLSGQNERLNEILTKSIMEESDEH